MAKLPKKGRPKTRRSSKQHWNVGESWIQKVKDSYYYEDHYKLIAILGKVQTKSGIRYKVAAAHLGEDFTEMKYPAIRSLARAQVERLLETGRSSFSCWRDECDSVELHRTDDRNWEQALAVVVKGGGPFALIDNFLKSIERKAENKKKAAERQYKAAEEQQEDMQRFREVVIEAMSKGD